MRIAIVGTGMVGRALAGRLDELGHEVVVGTRDPESTLARTEPDRMGNPPFAVWAADHPRVGLVAFGEVAEDADLVVNATTGTASLGALAAVGSAHLAGKVLLDLANPLDFSRGFPPTLTIKDTDSLGEVLQRSFPATRVVKSLNTMNASVMVNPQAVGDGATSVFMCGNDESAKALVASLLTELGWSDIIDLGDISAARGTELLMPVWLRLMGAFGTPVFNFQVVR